VFAQVTAARPNNPCSGKPGSPAQGAVAQYCPSEVKKTAPSTDSGGDSGGAAETVGTGAGSAGSDGDGPGGSPEKAGPEIPLTDYPSSSGVNALLIALLVAIAIALAYGARRWRRRSAEAQ
jgi:hypothetical protein